MCLALLKRFKCVELDFVLLVKNILIIFVEHDLGQFFSFVNFWQTWQLDPPTIKKMRI